jgi:hypothetical protein
MCHLGDLAATNDPDPDGWSAHERSLSRDEARRRRAKAVGAVIVANPMLFVII